MWTTFEESKRLGFERCAELIRDRIEDCKTLDDVKRLVDKILASVKEKSLDEIAQEVGLF